MKGSDLVALREAAVIIEAFNKHWTPHPGQIDIGRALFAEGAKQLFLRCGRRWGKTEFALHCSVLWAALHPGAAVYIIGPEAKQMREILVASQRLQMSVPPALLRGGSIATAMNLTEGRLWLANGAFVKVDGSDQVDSLRGLRVNFLVVDEYKDVRPDLLDVLRPTLLDFKAPILVCGTPPDLEDHYVKLDREAQSSGEWRWFKKPTSNNPYIDPALLAKERKRYEDNHELDVWQREYEAEIVLGGKRAIFPMFSEELHVKSYNTLLAKICQNEAHWNFYVSNDPGTASVFGSLLVAVNAYDGRVYFMDEVYETIQTQNSTGRIWPRVAAKQKELYLPDRGEDPWLVCYDEAATWFHNELLDQFGVASIPSQKAKNKKIDGISLLKDLMNSKKMQVSDRCVSFIKEIKGYRFNDIGQPVKHADHLIDCARYALGASHYSFQEADAPVPQVIPEDEKPRGFTPEQDFTEFFGEQYTPYSFDELGNDDVY